MKQDTYVTIAALLWCQKTKHLETTQTPVNRELIKYIVSISTIEIMRRYEGGSSVCWWRPVRRVTSRKRGSAACVVHCLSCKRGHGGLTVIFARCTQKLGKSSWEAHAKWWPAVGLGTRGRKRADEASEPGQKFLLYAFSTDFCTMRMY